MTIIAGFVPREEGHAALRLAAEEAKLRDCKLIVVAVGNIGEHQTPPRAGPITKNRWSSRSSSSSRPDGR